MNRLTSKKITITLTIIGLMILVSPIKLILAHSGHDHGKPEPKSTKIEPEKSNITEENIQSSPTPETQASQQTETQIIDVTLPKTNQYNFISKTSEIIFLLLLANPIILKIIKQKIHQQESL
ncbi:MAG: hypothetical protein QNJ33_04180 [Crocosphaera sp.]|nr:hypothetical protein [Crocosphaera sp.]